MIAISNPWPMTKTIILLLVPLLVFIVAWEASVAIFRVPEYLFPAFSKVALVIFDDNVYFFYHGMVTFFEALMGLLIAFSLSFFVACLFGIFPPAQRLVLPYAIAAQATPIVAIAPLLTLWLGSGAASKVSMAAIICFFPMLITSSRGLSAAPLEHNRLFGVYGASKLQTLFKLQIPTSVPYVFAGLRVSAALSMIGAIVAEFAGASSGLGYVIMQATYRLDTPRLFAGVLISIGGSLLLFSIIVYLERILVYKRNLGIKPEGAV